MSELISGKEALIAIANGQQVEGSIGDDWHEISTTSTVILNSFIFEKNRNGQPVKFRLKPRTITLNGIEAPKPDYIVDTPHDYQGTWEVQIGDMYYLFKSQDNYEKFVAALQSIFK